MKKTKKILNLGIKEERELLKEAKKALELMNKNEKKISPRSLKAVQLLIFYNQNLVKYIARGYSLFSGVDYEDLVSAGIESLPKAIEKFDLNVQSRFATYAGHWIRQYFQSFINKNQFISQKNNSSSELVCENAEAFLEKQLENAEKIISPPEITQKKKTKGRKKIKKDPVPNEAEKQRILGNLDKICLDPMGGLANAKLLKNRSYFNETAYYYRNDPEINPNWKSEPAAKEIYQVTIEEEKINLNQFKGNTFQEIRQALISEIQQNPHEWKVEKEEGSTVLKHKSGRKHWEKGVIGQFSSKKNVVYYDSDYQNEDKESQSYSLIDTLNDSGDEEITKKEVQQKDIAIKINDLINSLENRESILLTRITYKIIPANLLDIYYISTKEEQEELKKEMKLGKKNDVSSLQNYSLQEKKISNLSVVKKYLIYFSRDYKKKTSELSKLLEKKEVSINKLRRDSFKKLQELAKKKNLHFLM